MPLLEKGSGPFSAAGKGPDPFSETWLALDGAPALIVERAPGGGGIVRLGFNLAQALVALNQGVPEEDLTVRNRYPDAQAAHLESNDLVAHRALLDAPAPLADELERVVLAAVETLAPVAGWWPFPAMAEGVFLMTHDDEALARIDTGPPDVIVSDLAMPERDGFAFLRSLRAGGATMPVIALTALASAADRQRAVAAGFDVYLTKPVDPPVLVAAVARVRRPSGGGSPGALSAGSK